MDSKWQAKQLLNVIADHQWIYDVQLTHIFKEKTWKRLPKEWSDYLYGLSIKELSILPVKPPDGCPKSLEHFITACRMFSVVREVSQEVKHCELVIGKDIARGMNPKKLHEVSRLSGYINNMCQKAKCNSVVDVGSGLGYLGQCLAVQCGLNVVGIECEPGRVSVAADRMKKLIATSSKLTDNSSNPSSGCISLSSTDTSQNEKSSLNLVDEHIAIQMDIHSPTDKDIHSYCHCLNFHAREHAKCSFIEKDRDEYKDKGNQIGYPGSFSTVSLILDDSESSKRTFIQLIAREASKSGNVFIAGLHSCADLTPLALNALIDLRKSGLTIPFVLISCCYHKMTLQPSCPGSSFKYFPLSSVLRQEFSLVSKKSPNFSINIFGMRLAAQETISKWLGQDERDHILHSKRVAYRAILEVGMERANCINALKRTKRRPIKDVAMETFENYFEEVLRGSYMTAGLPDLSVYNTVVMETYREFKEYVPFVEVFTSLQVCLQGAIESLVLLDRLLYLKEHGIGAKLEPLFDDAISPRNVAIASDTLFCDKLCSN